MTKWYILLISVQLHVLLGNGKAEEINLIQSIKNEVSTSMSSTSTYQTSVSSWYSNNSIDNKATGDPNTCGCCAGTSGTEPPWLQIDLGSVYTIRKIQITGRSDGSSQEQFQNIYVYISNTTMVSSIGSLVYNGNSTTDTMFKLLLRPPISLRYLIIRRFYRSYLVICEVELFEAGINILDHIRDEVLANQSSTFLSNNTLYGPSNAIDGKLNYSINTCQCCSVTNSEPSWWQIDLRKMYSVDRLEIFGRGDLVSKEQLQGAMIFAGNLSLDNDLNQGQLLYTVPRIDTTTHFIHQLDEAVTAQFFIITLQSYILTLCEFIVYGTVQRCEVGRFGKSCNQICHCADISTCNVWTGKCKTPGCLPGWKGQACNKDCDYRRFGMNCSTVCNCRYNTSCNAITGHCKTGLCDPGWLGLSCDKGCDYRRFGINCSTFCNCRDNTSCNAITGHCKTGLCNPGWRGPSCDTICDYRRFGINCSSVCNCRDNTSCNAITGQCKTGLCDPGWLGPSCDKVCDYRRFGINCSTVCNCRYNTSCNAITGHCKTGLCDPGWLGLSCDRVCDHRRFGINCSTVCNCRDNTSCNAITGHCKTGLCDPGWLDLSCDIGVNLIERIKYQVRTNMSSEAKNTNSTFAVDGQLGPDPDKCQCCSITNNSPLSWWLLDLGKRYPLKSIIIYGRNKEDSYQQLTGFKLLLLNNTVDDKPNIFMSNDFLHTVGENNYEQTLNNTLARYIRIERPGVLTLCEIIIIEGKCRDGTFGEECVQDCHCADNKPCQTIHGYCQSPICKLGWMGRSCNESCTKYTFGEECKQVCYCEEGTCTSDYGICPGKCRYGYRGVHCNIEGIEELDDAKTADHSSSVVIGGSVAGGVVVIGILLLLVVLIYKQRMQRGKMNESENYYKTVHRNMAQVEDETTYDTIDISHDNQDQQNEEDNASVTGL